MNQHSAKSQTYKLYDERLQQLYLRCQVPPPVNEFDTNDIRRTSENPISESPPGSVFRGRTTSGDIVSIKMLSAFSSTEKAREVCVSRSLGYVATLIDFIRLSMLRCKGGIA